MRLAILKRHLFKTVVSGGLSHLRWTEGGARGHCNLTGTEAANDGATFNELPLPFSVSTIAAVFFFFFSKGQKKKKEKKREGDFDWN